MNIQNIYDDDVFFESYKQLRSGVNANVIVEIPAIFAMLPKLSGLRILDLGCGYGDHCVKYIEMGANEVVGVDISEKMLKIANMENPSPRITYKKMAMEDLAELDSSFDLVVSSLALHYVEDYKMVVEQVYRLLNKGGRFVFSQEHPFSTSFTYGSRWTKDEIGNKIYANISNYSIDGKRESQWFKDGVVKYHRTFSSLVNTLIDSGFCIEQMSEPIPSEVTMNQYPEYKDNIHKPDFLLIRVKKIANYYEVERNYNLRGLKIMSIELVKPSVEMETMILDFASEFKENKEDTINGCCGLTRSSNYHEWLVYIEKVENGLMSDRISSSTYVAIDKSSELIIGIIDIRHYLNEEHFYSGHIGYSVRPGMRNKNYGTEILQLGLKKAKELNLEKVLLTCNKSNVASQMVIEKNNGVLEKEILEDGEIYLVYWVSL